MKLVFSRPSINYVNLKSGVGIIAGGPYYCAMGNLALAEADCIHAFSKINVDRLVSLTQDFADKGWIDDPSHLSSHKAYIFSGALDTVVNQDVVLASEQYLGRYLSSNNIVADYNLQAEHCMPTLTYGEACEVLSSPYIGDCSFDGAGKIFETLYGDMTAPPSPTSFSSSSLYSFSQTPLIPYLPSLSSIAEEGFIYIPSSCLEDRECNLHVALHGCNQVLLINFSLSHKLHLSLLSFFDSEPVCWGGWRCMGHEWRVQRLG